MKPVARLTFAMFALHTVLLAEPMCVTWAERDFNNDGHADAISIWLMQGRKYEDTDMWEGAGEKYEGRFIVMVEISGKTPVAKNLNRLFYPEYEKENPMFFWCSEPWGIKFADYNHDGQTDFNLGQYGSGVANEYRLFTVSPTGDVSELSVEGSEHAFIGPISRKHSIDTLEITPTGFTCSYYSRGAGGIGVRDWYQWDEAKKAFMLVKQEPPDRRLEQSGAGADPAEPGVAQP